MMPLCIGASGGLRCIVPRVMVKRKIRESLLHLSADHFDPEKVYPDAYFRRM